MANRKKIVFDNRKESSVDSWKEIENANNFKLQARRKMFDSNNQRKGVITCKFKVPQYAIAKVEAKTDSSSGQHTPIMSLSEALKTVQNIKQVNDTLSDNTKTVPLMNEPTNAQKQPQSKGIQLQLYKTQCALYESIAENQILRMRVRDLQALLVASECMNAECQQDQEEDVLSDRSLPLARNKNREEWVGKEEDESETAAVAMEKDLEAQKAQQINLASIKTNRPKAARRRLQRKIKNQCETK